MSQSLFHCFNGLQRKKYVNFQSRKHQNVSRLTFEHEIRYYDLKFACIKTKSRTTQRNEENSSPVKRNVTWGGII